MPPSKSKASPAPSPLGGKSTPPLRPQAEEKLKCRANPDPDHSCPEEKNRLLHELHAHQIELEVQNEELQRAQLELDEARTRYFDLYDLAPVGYITLCADGLIQEVNLTAATMLGVNRTTLFQRPFSDFVCGEDRALQLTHWRQLLATREHQGWSLRLVGANRSPFWVQVQARVGPRGEFRITFTDISENKQAEEKLRESEARYRRITEGLIDYQYTVRIEHGRAVETNHSPACEMVTGYSAEDFAADPYLWIKMVTPDDRPRLTAHLQPILAGKEINPIEHKIVRKDGEVRWVVDKFILHRDEAGAILSYDGVVKDITERKRTRELFLHTEKLSAMGRLAASIAHEFNNPLQSVMNVIKGVRRWGALKAEDAKLMELAFTECVRMRDLIKSLQEFNRPTANRAAPMDLHAAIDCLLLLAKKECLSKHITLATEYAAALPPYTGIEDQIKQVILNLLNNAVDACEQGGIVTIKTEFDQENIILRVQDTGIGIQPENLSHIFEPFFSTKPAVKGTGLGLFVSYGIVKTHRGEIEVQSEVGKGSLFSVILPRAKGENGLEKNSVG